MLRDVPPRDVPRTDPGPLAAYPPIFPADLQTKIFAQIRAERQRQDRIWGQQNHPPEWWLTILGEEYGEACRGHLDKTFGTGRSDDHYPDELIQVAAVAVAALESYYRKNIQKGNTDAKEAQARKEHHVQEARQKPHEPNRSDIDRKECG